jgi:hypothetical protein
MILNISINFNKVLSMNKTALKCLKEILIKSIVRTKNYLEFNKLEAILMNKIIDNFQLQA